MNTSVVNLPIEKVVENDFLKALEEHEIKKDILVQQKNECLALSITDLTDKENYTLIRQTRLNQKAKRIIIEKVCKAGRDSAIKAQKAWIGFEKEFTDIISIGEKHLQEQEDIWDAEEDRKKNEKKILEEKQFSERSNILQNYGAKLIDGNFVLDNISYESTLIRETEEDIWNEMILPKYKNIFDAKEQKRIDDEKKLAQLETMRNTVYNARLGQLEKEELNISKEELIDMTDADFEVFKETHNGAIITAREKRAEKLALQKRTEERISSLFTLGLKFNGVEYHFHTIIVTPAQIESLIEDEWNNSIEFITKRSTEIKEEIKKKEEEYQQAAQELANKKADAKYRRNLMLGFGVDNPEVFYFDMDAISWARLAGDAEDKYKKKIANDALESQRKQKLLEDQQKLEEDAKLKDKPKWEAYIAALSAIPVPEFKTKKYQKNFSIAKEKIQEITNL